MEIKKTWFCYLSIFIYICGGILIFIYAVDGLGNGQEYPYFVKGMCLVIIALTYLAAAIFSTLGARAQLERMGENHPKLWKTVELGVAILILTASFLLRVWVIRQYPMEPRLDYKTYYEIAELINKNTLIEEGPGYCDYTAIFPHVLGYSYVLSVIFKMFGNSVWIGQLFNVIFAVITCFFVWRICVMLGGRISGMIGLIMTAFWPSQILYQTFLASEYVFSMLLIASIWLFLVLVKRFGPATHHPGIGILLHIVLGILIGIDAAIRPMALLLLISILICLVPSRMNLAIKPRNDLNLLLRGMEKGVIRGGIILAAYLITSAFLTKCVSFTIDEELATGTASFGYNLLVGLNQDSVGGWNDEDSDYLYSAMDMQGSPLKAQIACRDLAMERLKGDKKSLFNLFLHKYDVLWSNDEYAANFNMTFLKEQGNLTKEREHSLVVMRNIGNYWYLVCVAFSVIAAVYLLKRRGNWSIVLVILFLGTIAMHLLVENQNRYHFHALYLLVILSSQGLHFIYEDLKERIEVGKARDEWKIQFQMEQELALARIEEAQKYADEQRQSKMEGCFDMEKALREGLVIMSVTQEYGKETEAQPMSEQESHEDNKAIVQVRGEAAATQEAAEMLPQASKEARDASVEESLKEEQAEPIHNAVKKLQLKTSEKPKPRKVSEHKPEGRKKPSVPKGKKQANTHKATRHQLTTSVSKERKKVKGSLFKGRRHNGRRV